MAIFNSYVSLPEGSFWLCHITMDNYGIDGIDGQKAIKIDDEHDDSPMKHGNSWKMVHRNHQMINMMIHGSMKDGPSNQKQMISGAAYVTWLSNGRWPIMG